jgi:hypothetical protein
VFARGNGIEMLRVPFTSNPAGVTEVIAGRVSVMFPNISSSIAHVKAGTLRALASVTLGERSAAAPEFDVLHDEGHAYAQRLREAGVPVLARSYGAMNHGFLKYAGSIDQAGAAVRDACVWLSGVFAGAAPAHRA